jgi:hypothetical protein
MAKLRGTFFTSFIINARKHAFRGHWRRESAPAFLGSNPHTTVKSAYGAFDKDSSVVRSVLVSVSDQFHLERAVYLHNSGQFSFVLSKIQSETYAEMLISLAVV